jgi:tetratricopeptide (TPR) repeat protein
MRPKPSTLAVLAFIAVIASTFAVAAWLELPPGWFSVEGWLSLSSAQKLSWASGTFLLCAIITLLGVVVLRRAPRRSTGYPSLDAVIEAVQLGERVGWRFMRECKGGRQPTTETLPEDIPSSVGLTEEQRWLDHNGDLDRIEVLLRSSIALEERTPGANQRFNIANAYSKLGYHYRFRRDWERAIDALREAIHRFTAIGADAGDRQICYELATALFHLGEVYMARWRLGGADEDRTEAIRQLERSIQEDARWGNDDSLAQQRLRNLR